MGNIIGANKKPGAKSVSFWVGLFLMLVSILGLSTIGNFALNLVKNPTPIAQFAEKVNLSVNSRQFDNWVKQGTDYILEIAGQKKADNTKESPEAGAENNQGYDEGGSGVVDDYPEVPGNQYNYTGSSFIISCLMILALLKLATSICLRIFSESIAMIK